MQCYHLCRQFHLFYWLIHISDMGTLNKIPFTIHNDGQIFNIYRDFCTFVYMYLVSLRCFKLAMYVSALYSRLLIWWINMILLQTGHVTFNLRFVCGVRVRTTILFIPRQRLSHTGLPDLLYATRRRNVRSEFSEHKSCHSPLADVWLSRQRNKLFPRLCFYLIVLRKYLL